MLELVGIGAGLAVAAWGAASMNPMQMTWQDYLRGVYVLGLPGMGKTTLLIGDAANQFVNEFKGVIFIDVSDSCRKLLDLLPSNTDVVYVAPWKNSTTVGFNICHRYQWTTNEREKLTGNIVACFEKLFPRSWGDVIEHIFKNILLAVLEATEEIKQQITLHQLYQFIYDEAFRTWVLNCVRNVVVRSRLEGLSYDKDSSVDSVARKLADILAKETLVRLFAHPKGHDLRAMMDEQKMILFDLDTVKLDPNTSEFAAAMALTCVQNAAYSRKQDVSPGVVLYLDEFHRYANESIQELLSQARKYCVSTVLAHQTAAGQLSPKLTAAVHIASTHFYFRTTLEDSSYAAERCGVKKTSFDLYSVNCAINDFVEGLCGRGGTPNSSKKETVWTAREFVNLPAYVCVKSVSINNVIQPSRRVKLKRPSVVGVGDELIKASIIKYGRRLPKPSAKKETPPKTLDFSGKVS